MHWGWAMATNPASEHVYNQLASPAAGNVIQTGKITGGIHLHSAVTQVVVPRQLPLANRWFTGRNDELGSLSSAVDTGHHVAVVGAAGMGKTCLALHWAHQNVERFPDGQLFVDLRGRHVADGLRALLDGLDPDHRTLSLSFSAQVGRYRSLLARRQALIVLDNAADSAQVEVLLPGSGDSTVLITSRDRLDGLYASLGVHRVRLAPMAKSDATSLITQQIGEDRAALEPVALIELIDYCGRLPLALGVVAGRLATHMSFPLAAVAAELRDASTRIDALDTGEQTTTLTVVLSSSYDSLSPEARQLLGLIGLTTLPDLGTNALAALAETTPGEVRARMRELERNSLTEEHLPGRWQVHDLVRLHAARQVQDSELPARRLVDHYLHTALSGDACLHRSRLRIETTPPAPGSRPLIFDGYETALAWFDAEQHCLISAQRTAAQYGWHMLVWQLSWAMHSYRWRRAYAHHQAHGWRLALNAAKEIGDARWTAMAHRLLGSAKARISELDDAFEHLEQALALFVEQGDQAGQADVYRTLARTHEQLGEHDQALQHSESALILYRETRQPHAEADALDLVCWYEARLERFAAATRHGTAALDLYRQLDDHDGEATALDSLGYIAHRNGKHADAIDHYQRALAILRGRNTYHEANTLDRIAELHTELGQVDQARTAWERAIELFRIQRRNDDADRIQRRLDDTGDT